jgi:ribosomal protein S18 acetylase RimI-like enzyme
MGAELLSLDMDAAPHRDESILRQARLDSVRTSPEAFLTTVADIETKPHDHWRRELESFAWAVLEVDGKVYGIAAAKPPEADDTGADPQSSRFIESVWIAPSMRRRELGEHLVSYLIETQRERNVQSFFLWVFDKNRPAIALYERLGFTVTGRSKPLTPARAASVSEIQYKLEFENSIEGAELAHSEASRALDRYMYGANYRLLK